MSHTSSDHNHMLSSFDFVCLHKLKVNRDYYHEEQSSRTRSYTDISLTSNYMEQEEGCQRAALLNKIDEVNKTGIELSLTANYILSQAKTETLAATRLLSENNYPKALASFETAIGFYCYVIAEGSILAAVNAAHCYQRMKAASLDMQKYDAALEFSRQSIGFYFQAREFLLEHQCPTTSSATVVNTPVPVNQSCNLDTIILRALQHQASLCMFYHNDILGAIACCEAAACHLIDVDKHKQLNGVFSGELEGISYLMMSTDESTEFLGQILVDLGRYCTKGSSAGLPPPMSTYQQALAVLQSRLEAGANKPLTDWVSFGLRYLSEAYILRGDLEKGVYTLRDSLYARNLGSPDPDDLLTHLTSLALRYLSQVYYLRENKERAVDVLRDSMSIKLTAWGEPDDHTLDVMIELGGGAGKLDNFGACQIFEELILHHREVFGRSRSLIARSLTGLGGIVAREQNPESNLSTNKLALSLFKAANTIYSLLVNLTYSSTFVQELAVDESESGLEEEQKILLNIVEFANKSPNLPLGNYNSSAHVYLDLGLSFVSMQNFNAATRCFVAAITAADPLNEYKLQALLQRLHVCNWIEDPSANSSQNAPGVRDDRTTKTRANSLDTMIDLKDKTDSEKDIHNASANEQPCEISHMPKHRGPSLIFSCWKKPKSNKSSLPKENVSENIFRKSSTLYRFRKSDQKPTDLGLYSTGSNAETVETVSFDESPINDGASKSWWPWGHDGMEETVYA